MVKQLSRALKMSDEPKPKTFKDIKETATGKPLIDLDGKTFTVTESGTGQTEFQGQVQPTGYVIVDGQRYYTFSAVLIQQIKETLEPSTKEGVPVTVTLAKKKGKGTKTYYTFK